ncbi:MAG: RNA polymerase factor sigma-54 [Bacteroidetes bacterium]|nr:RNA polymerase factor sigma-54 [Bacteroidota bacterium]
MLKQRLEQKLLQKLSPQQIQLMKLLQVPSMALEQRIKQEIEENPALEEGREDETPDEEMSYEDDIAGDEGEEIPEESNANDEFNLEDYISDDDDTPAYKLSANNSSPDDDRRDIPFASGQSFQELLITQLGFRKLSEKEYQLGIQLIGNIDDSGYLERELQSIVNDVVFSLNIRTTIDELANVLEVIQEFDPPGVGARNLRECLIIQLERKEHFTEATENALLILKKFFPEFTRKHYDKITKRSGLSDDQLKSAMDEILKLNPKPGNSLLDSMKTNHYIVPDFILINNDGKLEVSLNSKNLPELRVNRAYHEMLETYQKSDKNDRKAKEAIMFVKQKIDSAKWFIDAVKQRYNTLETTMEAIVRHQFAYFQDGDETLMKPMILKDIAEEVHLDISTISRVVNSKFVQTNFGTFSLKSFFSESLSTDSGEEVSTREVKKILQDCIEAENKRKPLTDDHLAKFLKEKGYNIARRTVAKYREQLNIPVARLRKELT